MPHVPEYRALAEVVASTGIDAGLVNFLLTLVAAYVVVVLIGIVIAIAIIAWAIRTLSRG